MQYGQRKLQRSVTEILRSRSARPKRSGRPGRPSKPSSPTALDDPSAREDPAGDPADDGGEEAMTGREADSTVTLSHPRAPDPSIALLPTDAGIASVTKGWCTPVPPERPAGTSGDCTTAHLAAYGARRPRPCPPFTRKSARLMATTDTRTGFRLPWSSDRNQDATAAEAAAPAAGGTVEDAAPDAQSALPPAATGDHGEPSSDAGNADPSTAIAPTAAQEPAMIAFDQSPAPAPAAPRKPSKLMVDLGAAIRATADAARDQALAQVDADVAQVVEAIRNGSKDGEEVLRARSDEDVARIREWSRAEIARIKEETESRIAARKHGLDDELATHAAAIEQRVGRVEGTAAAYRASMHAYAESLGSEDDPSRLATLAESMPEPPELEAWADLSELSLAAEPPEVAPDHEMVDGAAPDIEAVAETIEMVETVAESPETVAERTDAARRDR